MAEWRFGRGWSDLELMARLRAAAAAHRNFSESDREMNADTGWSSHYSEAEIGQEAAGPPVPGGVFDRAWPLMTRYAFSDPRIVKGHFDAAVPLLGRVMLVEATVLGLHYLGSVVVAAVRDEVRPELSIRGYRYDTLEGHFERGCEWFLVTKRHATGSITFRVHAVWQRGQLPNAWSRLGFNLLARRYQRAWHRLAHLRMRALLGSIELAPLPRGARLVHQGPPLPLVRVPDASGTAPPPPISSEHEVPAHYSMETA